VAHTCALYQGTRESAAKADSHAAGSLAVGPPGPEGRPLEVAAPPLRRRPLTVTASGSIGQY